MFGKILKSIKGYIHNLKEEDQKLSAAAARKKAARQAAQQAAWEAEEPERRAKYRKEIDEARKKAARKAAQQAAWEAGEPERRAKLQKEMLERNTRESNAYRMRKIADEARQTQQASHRMDLDERKFAVGCGGILIVVGVVLAPVVIGIPLLLLGVYMIFMGAVGRK